MESGRYYVGIDLKFQIKLEADGFDQSKDRYDIVFYCGDKTASYDQDDVIHGDDGNYYLFVPTDTFDAGSMRMVITAYVPDSDSSTGYRKEIQSFNLGPLRPVL